MQDRYDELGNIIDTLDVLIDEITDNYYIETLREIKYEAENEKEEVENKLMNKEQKEQQELVREYNVERI